MKLEAADPIGQFNIILYLLYLVLLLEFSDRQTDTLPCLGCDVYIYIY